MFNPHTDAISNIFNIIKDMCSSKDDKTILYTEIEKKIKAKKLNEDILRDCIKQYENLNILYISNDKKEITLL